MQHPASASYQAQIAAHYARQVFDRLSRLESTKAVSSSEYHSGFSFLLRTESGPITLEATEGANGQTDLRVLAGNTNSQCITVIEMSEINQEYPLVRTFSDGTWVASLRRRADMIEEDLDSVRAIDDSYLFPEFAQMTMDERKYPVRHGKYGPWREGDDELHRWIDTILPHTTGYGNPRDTMSYQDRRIQLSARYSHHGSLLSLTIQIHPPFDMAEIGWLTVYVRELNGYLMTFRFKPGRWVYYIRDLAARPR
jgi:hypothetical protein